MLQVQGYYRKSGTGSAAGNLAKQVPEISQGFPEILQFYRATINVRFEPKIIAADWDHRTPPIPWDDQEAEVFDILRVRLVFGELGVRVSALMYVAHRSPHRKDPHKHEFLAENWVDGLQEDMSVVMECDRDFIELPYIESEQGGNGKPRLARTIVIR